MGALYTFGMICLWLGYIIGLVFVTFLFFMDGGVRRKGIKQDTLSMLSLITIWVFSPLLEVILVGMILTILISKGFRKPRII